MALSTGELLIHNPFILEEKDLAELKALGKVVGILVPNAFHGDETAWLSEKFPEAKVFVPRAIEAKARKKYRVNGSFENDWPADWRKDVECLPLEGMRLLHESVFFHKASRTLVVTDFVFNMKPEDFSKNFERTLMAWNRVGTGFGTSWLCDKVFTRDDAARKRSVEKILAWDFDRVVMNHGHVVENGGKAMMTASLST
ncbi:MAG: hypothetical protein HY075_10575 [Deltaproteobacteria bacterium]|nr:hypothetical protein [Deltaproteobacteria bacterium]